jgi:hypothetical protein
VEQRLENASGFIRTSDIARLMELFQVKLIQSNFYFSLLIVRHFRAHCSSTGSSFLNQAIKTVSSERREHLSQHKATMVLLDGGILAVKNRRIKKRSQMVHGMGMNPSRRIR